MIQALGDIAPRIAATAFVHERATVIGDVEIGEDSSVWPGAVIRGDGGPVRIGRRTSIQDNVVIHGTTGGVVIGDDCVVGHLAFLENAVLEDACLIAVGAMLHGAVMRTGSTAAAGAVLVGGFEVPPGYRAQGVPAKLVPDCSDSAAIAHGAAGYVALARRMATARTL